MDICNYYLLKSFLSIISLTFLLTVCLTLKFNVSNDFEYLDNDNNPQISNNCYTKLFGSSMYCIDPNGYKRTVSSYKIRSYEKKTLIDIIFEKPKGGII